MKANCRVLNEEDAVSPVIAVILMVAITVVLAATVYLWVSGFGTNQSRIIEASFSVKAVDLPTLNTTGNGGNASNDADTSPDAMQFIYSSGQSNFTWSDITISIDGAVMNANGTSAINAFVDSATAPTYCSSLPGNRPGATKTTWERGESAYIWKANGADCRYWAASPALLGTHSVQVSVRGQIVLDTSIEIQDDGKI